MAFGGGFLWILRVPPPVTIGYSRMSCNERAVTAHIRYWCVHSFDVAVFPGNCIEPKSQLPSNETVNIRSKWAITRQRVVELFDLVVTRILEMELSLGTAGESFLEAMV